MDSIARDTCVQILSRLEVERYDFHSWITSNEEVVTLMNKRVDFEVLDFILRDQLRISHWEIDILYGEFGII